MLKLVQLKSISFWTHLSMAGFNLHEYTWAEVRDQVAKADPELAVIIDEWNPSKAYTFYELAYSFGSHILDINNGGFQVPLDDYRTVPLHGDKVPSKLQHELGYNSLPLGIVIPDHGIEVYHQLDEKVFSLAFFTSGLQLGIWESFASPIPYSAVAGARSLIMAPKITDTESHKRLKETYGVKQSIPRHLSDQWTIYKELAKHTQKPWEVKILFMNSKWLEPKPKDNGWLRFYNFLLLRAWVHTEHVRSRSISEVTWKEICKGLQLKGEKFDPYLVETLRHLVSVSQGMLPALAAIGDSEIHGPINFIRKAYEEVYALKYSATILAPAHYGKTFKEDVPVYYSFQDPTVIDITPKKKNFASSIDQLRNYMSLYDYFLEEGKHENMMFSGVPFKSLTDRIKVDYFHSEMHTYGGILPSEKLPEEDANLIYSLNTKNKKPFASKGSFFRCCLRISQK